MALMIAAGCSLLAVAGPPLVHSRPGIRRAIGLVLATQAVLLIRVGVGGPATDLEEVARAALLVTAAAAGAALTRATSVATLAARTTSGDNVVETESGSDSEEEGPKASRRRAASP
jgi:hypothetical protein